MVLKNWEVWDAEEREIKILRDLTIKLWEKAEEITNNSQGTSNHSFWKREGIEEAIKEIYKETRELKRDIYEKKRNLREKDERISVLEEIVYLLRGAMEGLKSACETTENEKLKLKLRGGILVFEFAINIIRYKIELLSNEVINDKNYK